MWIFLALSCAFLTATSATISKIILRRNDEYLVGWLRLVISAPVFLLLFLKLDVPHIDNTFFLALVFLMPLEITAYLLYIKAIKHSPISLTMPFLAFTPVFIILTGRLILGEAIDLIGLSGILLVAFGAYLLNIERFSLGALEPLRSIIREKGSVYMIIVSFIYSITAVLGKLAITHSSPLFFSAVYYPIVAVFLSPLVAIRYRQGILNMNMLKKDKYLLLLLSIIFAFSMVLHCLAISMAKAAYMISIKRLSMVFAVIYGWLIFREKSIPARLIGAAVMFLGVLIISLAK